jgi:hypothetical protein
MNQAWKRRGGCLLLLALVFVAAAPRVLGWGETGHVIVAMIAEKHLKQNAKHGIAELLGTQRISSPAVAVWADKIRHVKVFEKKFPKNGQWHYVDIPFDAKEFDPARDCKTGNCVIDKIAHFQKVLADHDASKEDRIAALKFLVHFVGDMHQPLHCAERNGDRGGNQLKVHINGTHDRETNLHSLWDTFLVTEAMHGLGNADYVQRIDADVTSELKKAWAKGDVKSWAWEAHQLAVTKAYTDSSGKVFPMTHAEVDDAYLSDRKIVVETQLKRGGIRLAKVLNDAFKKAPAK